MCGSWWVCEGEETVSRRFRAPVELMRQSSLIALFESADNICKLSNAKEAIRKTKFPVISTL
jgi:hypothetical protein